MYKAEPEKAGLNLGIDLGLDNFARCFCQWNSLQYESGEWIASSSIVLPTGSVILWYIKNGMN